MRTCIIIRWLTIFICFRKYSFNQSLEQHGQKQIPSDFSLWEQTRKTASETARNINEAFGERSVPVRTTQPWFQRFREGDERLDDIKHTGKKWSLDADTLREVVEVEPPTWVHKLAQNVVKTKSTIFRHLLDFGKKKKMDKSVVHELTGDQKNDVTSSV